MVAMSLVSSYFTERLVRPFFMQSFSSVHIVAVIQVLLIHVITTVRGE